MRAPRPSPAMVAALAFLAAGCAGDGSAPQRHGIEIRAFVFSPDTQAAQPGDTVVFVNHDAVPHTATADNGAWDTGSIPANGTKTVVIPSTGTGPYRCAIHPTMTGRIEPAE